MTLGRLLVTLRDACSRVFVNERIDLGYIYIYIYVDDRKLDFLSFREYDICHEMKVECSLKLTLVTRS